MTDTDESAPPGPSQGPVVPGGGEPSAPETESAAPAGSRPSPDELDQQLEREFAGFAHHKGWKVATHNSARELLDRLQEAECGRQLGPCDQDQARMIRLSLLRALKALSDKAKKPGDNKAKKPGDKVRDWASGSAVETARMELHSASERLLMIQTVDDAQARLGDVDAALRNSLKADDPRLAPAITRLATLGAGPPDAVDKARSEIRKYLQTADAADAAAHANVRSFRNLLVFIGGLITLATCATALVHALVPEFLDLSGPAPAKGTTRPDAVEVWQVALAGGIGGLVAALFSITRLAGFSGAYRLPTYQALIRIPSGALVGLVAAILLQGQFIDVLKPQFGLSLLAYALVFGYAPEVLLRFVDQRAQTVLGQAQHKDDPAAPAMAKPA